MIISRVRVVLILIVVALMSHQASATHIRAGEITIERKNCQSLTFTITITGYVDLIKGQVLFGGGTLDFGDGSDPIVGIRGDSRVALILDEVPIDNGNGVGITQFQVEHTFSANGTYIISYNEPNRNADILNMDNSVNTPFYVQSVIRIDPFLGCNNSPVMLVPPIDFGCTGVAFFHNPGAFDKDGDSLSFEFVTPRKAVGINVDNYRLVNDASFGGSQESGQQPTIFSINPITGDVLWDAPAIAGEYNIAFVVREFRKVKGKFFEIGSVVRDMQIIVDDCENNRPELQIPDDLCVEAGTSINEVITATDLDGDDVMIEVFSGIIHVGNSPATFAPDPPVFQKLPAQVNFQWNTTCDHIRQQPYLVTFKVTDKPDQGVPLVEFATLSITVVAPSPKHLSAKINSNRTIDLSWDKYVCPNADSIQIWRRVDSYDFTPDACEVGMPDFAGYELLTKVEANSTSYTDDNLGKLLAFDANYCYRLVAQFPLPQGGESFVSNEACGLIKADAPAITHVTVDETNLNTGKIRVSWRGPFEIDKVLFPPPYQYELWRGEDFSGPVDQKIMTLSSDTTFQDTGLNTEEHPYHYVVKLFDSSGQIVRESVSASSVRLEPAPLIQGIELSWDAEVPWSNNLQDFPMHLIYRDHADPMDDSALVLIDSVNVNENGFKYLDEGQFNGVPLADSVSYCYYVTTFGSYGNPKIDIPQINLSQVVCAQPNDTIPPCSPTLSLQVQDCEAFLAQQGCAFNAFFNTLTWEISDTPECKDQLSGYNIYFSETGEEGSFELVGFSKTTDFTHTGLSSFKGCYYVTALDRSMNESEPSETVCNDNCPYYKLPNVFTPNGDGKNDTFRPLDEFSNDTNAQCPRFVQSIHLKIFNRWGLEVFDYQSGGENTIFVNWDGRDNDGTKLPSAIYYYSADLTFDVLNPKEKEQTITGWVQVLY